MWSYYRLIPRKKLFTWGEIPVINLLSYHFPQGKRSHWWNFMCGCLNHAPEPSRSTLHFSTLCYWLKNNYLCFLSSFDENNTQNSLWFFIILTCCPIMSKHFSNESFSFDLWGFCSYYSVANTIHFFVKIMKFECLCFLEFERDLCQTSHFCLIQYI